VKLKKRNNKICNNFPFTDFLQLKNKFEFGDKEMLESITRKLKKATGVTLWQKFFKIKY